jgi:chemotaxis protein MotB
MVESRIARVVGLGSAVLLDAADPFNPTNRRVSIIVMNRKAEEAALNDGGVLEAETAGDVREGVNGDAAEKR